MLPWSLASGTTENGQSCGRCGGRNSASRRRRGPPSHGQLLAADSRHHAGVAATDARHHDRQCRYPAYARSEEHTSELQSLMRISYAVFCLKKKKTHKTSNQKIKSQQNISDQHTTTT